MKTRKEILSNAVLECMKDIYSFAQPHIDWEDFVKQNKEFIKKEEEYYKIPKDDRPLYEEYCGPKSFEFYYIPNEILKDIVQCYIDSYKIDDHQEFVDTIELLKNYCKCPLTDEDIKPNNLEKEIKIILENLDPQFVDSAKEIQNKFFEFLDMAKSFFRMLLMLLFFLEQVLVLIRKQS